MCEKILREKWKQQIFCMHKLLLSKTYVTPYLNVDCITEVFFIIVQLSLISSAGSVMVSEHNHCQVGLSVNVLSTYDSLLHCRISQLIHNSWAWLNQHIFLYFPGIIRATGGHGWCPIKSDQQRNEHVMQAFYQDISTKLHFCYDWNWFRWHMQRHTCWTSYF